MEKPRNFIASALRPKSHPVQWNLDKDPDHAFHALHIRSCLQFQEGATDSTRGIGKIVIGQLLLPETTLVVSLSYPWPPQWSASIAMTT